jgi:alpha-galactosidase
MRAHDHVWTLPDPQAQVREEDGILYAEWPDGVLLMLQPRLLRQNHLETRALSSKSTIVVDEIGVRLRREGSATRMLVDGYHSWDWAGVRDATVPGRGWWGCVWGNPADPVSRCAVSLAHLPVTGALALRWEGDGILDVASCGVPEQQEMRTGAPRSLGRTLTPETIELCADGILLRGLPQTSTRPAGLPVFAGGPVQTERLRGWMSWNCLGAEVQPEHVLAAAHDLVPEGGVVLLDDGWMSLWGDWTERERFAPSVVELAGALADSGRRLGLWLAPFAVDVESAAAKELAPLLLRDDDGEPVVDTRPARPQYVLDASNADAREHLHDLGRHLGLLGVSVLKADFLYQGALHGHRPPPSVSQVLPLRNGLRELERGFRGAAPQGAQVWACGAPGPVVAGIADACRSGGDAVVNVPSANAPPPQPPLFAHGEALIRAQERNLAARSWLWGGTLPCDTDAITLGGVGPAAPVDDAAAARWLRLVRRSGGPGLDSDLPSLEALSPDRLASVRELLAGAPAAPERPADPLALAPVPATDDDFVCWQDDIPEDWTPIPQPG